MNLFSIMLTTALPINFLTGILSIKIPTEYNRLQQILAKLLELFSIPSTCKKITVMEYIDKIETKRKSKNKSTRDLIRK